jgi:Zn-dependent protease with chaperone function
VFYLLFSSLLKIPPSLPEGTIVPDEVREILSEDRIDQAIIYSDFRHGWYFFDNLFGFSVLIAILLLGISGSIRNRAEKWSERLSSLKNAPLVCSCGAAFFALLIIFLTASEVHPVSSGSLGIALAWGLVGLYAGKSRKFALSAFYIILFLFLLTIINFPLVYYRSFVVEHYFDLSTEPFGSWFADLLKGELVSYLMFIVLAPFAYWGIRKRTRDWWLWVSVASVPITIFFVVVTPVYLDPLFNTYEPLKDEALRTRILTMAEEAGISGSRVYQVDKSKDTQKVNAYVTGLFGTKRIVMWDTILEKMTPDELSFVMAHEMGHYILKHVWMFIGVLAVILFVLLFIISRTIGWFLRRFGDRMGFHELSDIASLPLLLFMLSVLSFLTTPALNLFGRSIEHDSDVFGLEMTKDGSAAATAFIKLANENLSNPSPHPFIEFWLFDHPTLSDRIAFCREYITEDVEEEGVVEDIE